MYLAILGLETNIDSSVAMVFNERKTLPQDTKCWDQRELLIAYWAVIWQHIGVDSGISIKLWKLF